MSYSEVGCIPLQLPVEDLLQKLKRNKQLAVDCLIASRAAYEPTLEGVADVLERRYDVGSGSNYELLFHKEHSAFSREHRYWFDQQPQQQVFLILRSSNGYVIVAFRGTFTLKDAIQDMKMATVRSPFSRGRAHAGFMERSLSIPLQLLMRLSRPGEKLIFTGHSLGGAVASLSTLRVLEELASSSSSSDPASLKILRNQVLCITFGTAQFANQELAAYINSRYRDRFYHLISKHDLVPRALHILPRCFQKIVKVLGSRREVKAIFALAEQASGTSVEKAFMELMETVLTQRINGPAKETLKFVRESIINYANQKETSSYGLCGYVLHFNPDAKDTESVMMVDYMENLEPDIPNLEGKSSWDVLFEHGLQNHYICIIQGLFGRNVSRPNSTSTSTHVCLLGILKALVVFINEMLSDPANTFLLHFGRLMLTLVGNDINPTSLVVN